MEILILEWGDRMHPIIFQNANEYKGYEGCESCKRCERCEKCEGYKGYNVRQVQRVQGGNEVDKRGATEV